MSDVNALLAHTGTSTQLYIRVRACGRVSLMDIPQLAMSRSDLSNRKEAILLKRKDQPSRSFVRL